jgi:hypothetical protein
MSDTDRERVLIGTALDGEGRLVELTEARWRHIIEGHPELWAHQGRVLAAINEGERRPGRWPDEEWFYLATSRPSRWLKVVVRYNSGRGEIVTAFPRRSLP